MAISPNAISTLTGSTKTVSNKQRKELEVSVMSINKAIVVGNLGRDPEVRALPSGQNVVNFSVATKARFKDRNGEQQERTEWHRVVAFGKLADNCQRLLSTGRQVYVEGRLRTRQYQARDGSGPRYRTEIVALQLRVLGNRLNSNAPNTETSDDIPF
jgi:single-strand DNA-binding protein